MESLRRYANWIVPSIGLGLMLFYELCDTACSSLQGTFLGVDLKGVGVIFMVALLVLNLLERGPRRAAVVRLRTILLAGALGGEVLLVRFQILHETYCSFCLAFGLCLVILFGVNGERRQMAVAVPAFLAGLAAFALFFEGSVLPLYRF